MRKPTFWFPTRSITTRAVQPQKMARGLKFWIKKVERLFYLCSENKSADQLRGSASLFSHMQNVGFLITRLNYIFFFGIQLRIKSLFFYVHDVMKTVGGAKIP